MPLSEEGCMAPDASHLVASVMMCECGLAFDSMGLDLGSLVYYLASR